jgi:hypothetical protein
MSLFGYLLPHLLMLTGGVVLSLPMGLLWGRAQFFNCGAIFTFLPFCLFNLNYMDLLICLKFTNLKLLAY